MKNLRDYQESFLNSILENERPPELLDLIKPIGNLNSVQALDIYREDYAARLDSVMRENFKATWLVLGEDDFVQAVCEYKKKYPSAHPDLGQYGEHFPLFLDHSVYREKFPLIKDLAQLEWDLEQVFHSGYPIFPDPFKKICETDLVKASLQFHPSLKTYAWDFALYDIVDKSQNPSKELEELNFQRPQYLLLYKVDELVRTKELESVQWEVMQSLQMGHSLERALDGASCDDPATIREFFAFLRNSGLAIAIV